MFRLLLAFLFFFMTGCSHTTRNIASAEFGQGSSLSGDGCGRELSADEHDVGSFKGKTITHTESKETSKQQFEVVDVKVNLGVHSSARYASCSFAIIEAVSKLDAQRYQFRIDLFTPVVPSFDRVYAMLKGNGYYINSRDYKNGADSLVYRQEAASFYEAGGNPSEKRFSVTLIEQKY